VAAGGGGDRGGGRESRASLVRKFTSVRSSTWTSKPAPENQKPLFSPPMPHRGVQRGQNKGLCKETREGAPAKVSIPHEIPERRQGALRQQGRREKKRRSEALRFGWVRKERRKNTREKRSRTEQRGRRGAAGIMSGRCEGP